MKKVILSLICLMLIFITSCNSGSNQGSTKDNTTNSNQTEIVTENPVTDETINATEVSGEFSIVTSDGEYSVNDSIYTITKAGTYTLSGYLNGQILVEAGEEDAVVLELSNVTIESSTDSPIKILTADEVDISAKKNTENVIKDLRNNKTVDTDTLGEGAIYSKVDLKLKGTGTLVITANYNNGVHTTKDLKIQKLSLKVTAYNNALKGNDSITISSGNVVAISTAGDGIKSQNTDVNKNGVTRGDITITGSSNVVVYAAGDGIQAAHNFVLDNDADGNSPYVTIYTGSYSGYTSSKATTTSYKGVKVENLLNINNGKIEIKSYDDGLHANYGTKFDDGTSGLGTINVNGGIITMVVYAPNTKTGGGRMGPGGWGGQQSVSGADAIHADYMLNITGGEINIDSSYEGLEANVINISGGVSIVSANDDGVNACSGITTPKVVITGGYLDVTVPSNGDTDGIDSNGTYTQSGGIVITRGPNQQMAAAIDADSSVTITGGTLIILGYGNVRTSGVKAYSLSLHSSGDHSVTIDGTTYNFTNKYSYGRTICYSSVVVK